MRAWKIAEDSQLVFQTIHERRQKERLCHGMRGLGSHDHWITGARDGAVSLWSASKKKPLSTFSNVHGYDEPIGVPKNWEEEDGEIVLADRMATQEALNLSVEDKNRGGCGYLASSVVSAAVGKGTNLCATGAGDGTIRLWKATPGGERYRVGTETLVAAERIREWISHRVVWKVFVSLESAKSRDSGGGEETQERKWSGHARLDHIVEDDSDEDDEESDDSMDEEEDD